MLTDRQKLILKIIVEEHVKTTEPVGSKSITDSGLLNCSSATIRNEMMELEKEGLIQKTHISSGRIPTEDGYRLYVNELINSNDEEKVHSFPLIDSIFNSKRISKEEAIKESMSLVSELTNYASVALGDTARKSLIKKLQFVDLGKNLGVLLLVTSNGHVESKKIIIPEDINTKQIEKVINVLNKVLFDCPISEIDNVLKDRLNSEDIRRQLEYNEQLVGVLIQAVASMFKDQVFVLGQRSLLNQPEFQDMEKAKSLYEVIDNINLVDVVDSNSNSISVKIGSDISVKAMEDCTIVSIPYNTIEGERGALAVIGPKRMEYNKVIPLLEYIAEYISKM